MIDAAALSLSVLSTADSSSDAKVDSASGTSSSSSSESSSFSIAFLILESCSLSFTTGSADSNCEMDSISSGDRSRSPASISAACSFKSSCNSSTLTSMASNISSFVIFPASSELDATASVVSDSGAIVSTSSFSEASCFFFVFLASRSACSSLIFSFWCVTTSSWILRTSGSDLNSSDVATWRITSFKTSLSIPLIASARPVTLWASSLAAALAGEMISFCKKKVRLMIKRDIGTSLFTLKSSHC
mmetsp:Transcript_357/g.765  ORF Transcript_357/g.765 Transcript_357/m.765 type:complete len:246 (+) Transcript_357:2102-2839(+)